MAFVSVTRLQVRSLRYLPQFVYYTLRTKRQLRRSPGFAAGWLGNERVNGFWTATAWSSNDAMRTFRNGPPHLQAMQKLLQWCDEASYVHWDQERAELPDGDAAFRRMRSDGRTSKVLHPSARHAAGRTTGDAAPTVGQRISPA